MTVPEIGALALAAVFGAGGVQQLIGVAPMRELAERLETDYRVFRFIGLCQTLGALGLVAGVVLEPWMGIAAATGLALLAVLGWERTSAPRSRWWRTYPRWRSERLRPCSRSRCRSPGFETVVDRPPQPPSSGHGG